MTIYWNNYRHAKKSSPGAIAFWVNRPHSSISGLIWCSTGEGDRMRQSWGQKARDNDTSGNTDSEIEDVIETYMKRMTNTGRTTDWKR